MTVNKSWPDVTQVWVSVVFKDGDGHLMGGDFTFVDVVEEGETAAVDVGVYGNIPDYSSFELHGMPW